MLLFCVPVNVNLFSVLCLYFLCSVHEANASSWKRMLELLLLLLLLLALTFSSASPLFPNSALLLYCCWLCCFNCQQNGQGTHLTHSLDILNFDSGPTFFQSRTSADTHAADGGFVGDDPRPACCVLTVGDVGGATRRWSEYSSLSAVPIHKLFFASFYWSKYWILHRKCH